MFTSENLFVTLYKKCEFSNICKMILLLTCAKLRIIMVRLQGAIILEGAMVIMSLQPSSSAYMIIILLAFVI